MANKVNTQLMSEKTFLSLYIVYIVVTTCVSSDNVLGQQLSQQNDIVVSGPPLKSVVKCEDPGTIENGYRKVMKDDSCCNDSYLYNTNVNFECNPEYRMIGVPFLTCKADGKWNRQKPKCQSMSSLGLLSIDFNLNSNFIYFKENNVPNYRTL